MHALYNKRALKNNGVPENRNARSGVRFLGKRSNKCTRAWRQTKCAACRPSPCCDERKERKQAVSGAAARPWVFSEIKQKLSSLLRDFARRVKLLLAQAKPRFCVSAPVFARKRFCRKGEAAVFYAMCAHRNAAARKTPDVPNIMRATGLS